MDNDPTSDGNQLHGEAEFLDSVLDQVSDLQTDGGVSPELRHHPTQNVQPPPPRILRRRNDAHS